MMQNYFVDAADTGLKNSSLDQLSRKKLTGNTGDYFLIHHAFLSLKSAKSEKKIHWVHENGVM